MSVRNISKRDNPIYEPHLNINAFIFWPQPKWKNKSKIFCRHIALPQKCFENLFILNNEYPSTIQGGCHGDYSRFFNVDCEEAFIETFGPSSRRNKFTKISIYWCYLNNINRKKGDKLLNSFQAKFPFLYPWKYQKTRTLRMFSEVSLTVITPLSFIFLPPFSCQPCFL